MNSWKIAFSLSLMLLASPGSGLLHAQFGDITKAVKRGAEQEAANQAEQLTRKAVRCVFNDLECIKKAENEGDQLVLTDEKGTVLTDSKGKPRECASWPGNGFLRLPFGSPSCIHAVALGVPQDLQPPAF